MRVIDSMLQPEADISHSEPPDYQTLVQPTAVTTTATTEHGLVKFSKRTATGIGTAFIAAAAADLLITIYLYAVDKEVLQNPEEVGFNFWVSAIFLFY